MEIYKNYPSTILLADDDPDDRELFGETIRDVSPKSDLLTFDNGKEILAYLEKNPAAPDLIFLDINMPQLCGKECLKEIRQNVNFNNVPIVIFSTSTNDNDIYETYKYGANLFMTKPGSYIEQVDIFRRFFNLYHMGRLMDRTMSSYVLIPTVAVSYRSRMQS